MTVVVADSSPLNYLILIGSVDLLHQLYDTVVVPRQVIAELTDDEAPREVKDWALNLPAWIDVRAAAGTDEAELLHLDSGERAAIAMAQSEPGSLLLIDDAAGRLEATRRGIATTGTLGVLRAAAVKKLVELPPALGRLLESNFRVSMTLVTELLEEDADRRRKQKGE